MTCSVTTHIVVQELTVGPIKVLVHIRQVVRVQQSIQVSIGVGDVVRVKQVLEGSHTVGKVTRTDALSLVIPGLVELNVSALLVQLNQMPHAFHGGVQHPEGHVIGRSSLQKIG